MLLQDPAAALLQVIGSWMQAGGILLRAAGSWMRAGGSLLRATGSRMQAGGSLRPYGANVIVYTPLPGVPA